MENGRSAPLTIRVSDKEREAVLWKAREGNSSMSGVLYEMLKNGGLDALVKEFLTPSLSSGERKFTDEELRILSDNSIFSTVAPARSTLWRKDGFFGWFVPGCKPHDDDAELVGTIEDARKEYNERFR